MVLRSGLDLGDLEGREGLAVSRLAAVALAALVLEDGDLLAQALLDDLGLDLDAGHLGLADRDAARVVGEEQGVEGELAASRARELLDAQELALGDAVLLSTSLNHGVHRTGPPLGTGDFIRGYRPVNCLRARRAGWARRRK